MRKRHQMKDLMDVVDQVHNTPQITPPKEENDLSNITPDLLLMAGDEPDRRTFFDLDDGYEPIPLYAKDAYLTLKQGVSLPAYRDTTNKQIHRTCITIPPKIRENIRAVLGIEEGDDMALTVALVALADYAMDRLTSEGKRLVVSQATDEKDPQRMEARRRIRLASGAKR